VQLDNITTAPINSYQVYHNFRVSNAAATVPAANPQVGLDGLVEFDQLPMEHVCLFLTSLALRFGVSVGAGAVVSTELDN
jgi:hypothetical protein